MNKTEVYLSDGSSVFMPENHIYEGSASYRYEPLRGYGYIMAVFDGKECIGYILASTLGYANAAAAVSDLSSTRQTIGVLSVQLSRCEPGSKKYKEVWDTMTRLENEASEMSSIIRTALRER